MKMLPALAVAPVLLLLTLADAPPVGPVPASATPAKPVPIAAATAASPTGRQARRSWHRPSPALGSVVAANRSATQEPVRPGFVNAAQIYAFADGALYKVYTAPERVTDIQLQPGETLGAVAAGDTARWVIGNTDSGAGEGRRTHILVKPFAAGLATNLVITTDRRSYHVSLASTAGTAMAAVSWTYPQDALIAFQRATAAAEAAAPVASGLALERLRFDYALSGDQPAWRPLRAFDDGRQTFIEFPAAIAVGEAPPLFVIGAGGEAQLVNYRQHGRFYIVDRLFDIAELRLGTKKAEIVRISRVAEPVRGRAS